MTNNDINNEVKENEKFDAALDFFKRPEYQKVLAEREMDDQSKAYYTKLVDSTTRNGGVYHTPNVASTVSSQKSNKLINKSIGNNKKVNYNRKKSVGERVINMPNSNKVTLILCSALMLLSLAVGTYSLAEEEIHDYFQARATAKVEYDTALSTLKSKAQKYLCDNFLAIKAAETGEIVVKENSVAEYSKLDISNPLDVYIYSLILPESELPKFIQSVSYQEYGCDRNYVSMEQFLRINGMFDKKTGYPSGAVFTNMMEAEIRNMSSAMIEIYNHDENLRTYSELIAAYETLKNINGMGGK